MNSTITNIQSLTHPEQIHDSLLNDFQFANEGQLGACVRESHGRASANVPDRIITSNQFQINELSENLRTSSADEAHRDQLRVEVNHHPFEGLPRNYENRRVNYSVDEHMYRQLQPNNSHTLQPVDQISQGSNFN